MLTVTPDSLLRAGLATTQAVADRVAPALDAACRKHGIDTGVRIAGFLAQAAHESVSFRVTVENLNYGAAALLATFPRCFDAATAAAYAHQQERIADRVYGGRLGNGPEPSGDGWRYRGRGYIQLTGRANYEAFGRAIGADALGQPDLVAQPELAAESAAWFWEAHGINAAADAGDIARMTRLVNGGLLGIQERTRLWEGARAVFAP